MAQKIVVLGSGPGGYVAALRAAQLGADVTIIERDNVGGTCLNWGCIPSKVMITTAELFERFQRAEEFGIELAGSPRINMHQLMARKNMVVSQQIEGILGLFQKHKIRYIKGTGILKGSGKLEVKPPEGDVIPLLWDKLILAVGTRPAEIDRFPFDGKYVLSSNHALGLEVLPESILIVGGGVVGCEFACMLAALGAKVTLVEALSRVLPLSSVDEDCSKVLQREMKKRKIKVHLGRMVNAIEERSEMLQVIIEPSTLLSAPTKKTKGSITVWVDKVLVCIGRTPNSESMGLEMIGLETDDNGWIKTNERLETNVANIYAIGDVLGPQKIMLAHVASAEGIIAADNAMGDDRNMNYRAVPGAIFTSPEVANVGLTESQAGGQGYDIRSDITLFRTVGKAHVIGDIAGQVKIVSEVDTGQILGFHIIGPRAADLIAEATVAIQMKATTRDLAETIHTHPTLSEVILEVSSLAIDKPRHA